MEAVPRLPMLSFQLKTSPETTSFGNLKQYIAEYYQENPDSYSKEVYQLEALRNSSIRPTHDVNGCSTMKRYYCQLHSIQNRFLLNNETHQLLTFNWRDVFSGTTIQKSDLKYEMAAVLYNIGALHTQLGAEESRSEPESMKKACTHYQCAGWAFGYIKDNYSHSLQGDLSSELLIFLQHLSFAQAQECILEKSLTDNRKSGIVTKIAAQIVNYYNSALAALLSQTGDDNRIQDLLGNKTFKEWRKYVKFKISYLSCIMLLYQGQQAEDSQKMGERVTLFQAAFDKLEEARKESKGMQNIDAINNTLQFTMDVVEAKRKSAKNENDFIYHEEAPELTSISAVQGANLVNGIGFSITDTEVAGEDIFHRLVPMKAHESSSVYSEEKATLLRSVGTKVEDKDIELNTFMSSLNVENINACNTMSTLNDTKLPQGLVDRCAALNAKPNAIPSLVQSMSNLAEICTDVESMLNEIKHLLQQDEIHEDKYQQKIGQRSNGGAHITELTREFTKYLEAHNKAGESNETLRKAMGLHVSNLKILAQPLKEIQKQIPIMEEKFEESSIKNLQIILGKVSEMQNQRGQLYKDLREAITNDDITSQLIAIDNDKEKMEELFKKELSKHEKSITLIEQNLKAQSNILKALTDTYAKCAPIIKTINDIKQKRDHFFSSLQGSYDVYEDLLSKSAKGLEFYKKLHGNVQKLLSRVKAACDVQDEERSQKLKSTTLSIKKSESIESKPASTGPKLKDYLNSGFSVKSSDVTGKYIPPIRPNPVGSESSSTPASTAVTSATYYDSYNSSNYSAYPQQQPQNPNPTAYSANPSATDYYQQLYQYQQQQQQQQQLQQPRQDYPVAASTPSSVTGYVNPIYQNSPYYGQQQYYGQQTTTSDQRPQSQPSPAPSNISLDQQSTLWNQQQQQQLSQQFSNLNLQNNYSQDYSSGNYNYNLQTTTQPVPELKSPSPALPYENNPQVQQQQQQQQQQYYNPTPSIEQYQQPQSQPQSQQPQTYQTYPGYTYNPQTGAYEYTGSNDPQQTAYSQYPNTTIQTQVSQPQVEQNYSTPQTQTTQPQQQIQTNESSTLNYYNQTYASGGYQQVDSTTQYQQNIQQQQQQTYDQYTAYNSAAANLNQTGANIYNVANSYGVNQPTQDLPPQTQQPSFPTQDPTQQQYQQDPNLQTQQQLSQYYQLQQQQQIQPNQTSVVSNQQTQPYSTDIPPKIETQTPATTTTTVVPKSSSNIDLLSGIDFNIPIPVTGKDLPILQPQTAATNKQQRDDDIKSEILTPTKTESVINQSTSLTGINQITQQMQPPSQLPPSQPQQQFERKSSVDNLSTCSDISSIDQNFDWDSVSMKSEQNFDSNQNRNENIMSKFSSTGSTNSKDPFDDGKNLKWFHKEVERLEKFIESLNVKTLNGSTPIDSKWKELQDMLVKDESKHQLIIAKLFPEKNRSTDSIPYDHARVLLPTTTDNYINAAYLNDLGSSCPTLILAQTPLTNTINDFWNMIWSQKSNIVVCLHTPNEILDPFWPTEVNKETSYGDISVTLLKQFDLTHCIERSLKVTMHGSDFVLNLSLLQIKAWAKNSPDYILGIAQNIIDSYKQQNQSINNAKDMKTLIMNCLTGSERSPIVTLAIATILATQTRRPILINVVDIWYRICCQRKGALRDINALQFSYQIVLSNAYSILNKRGIMTSYQMKNVQTTTISENEETSNDPFKDLDPLWKLK
uniref:Putative tyrosine-protein phosphatase non-receptor type 23 n=1 Tax=Corethrella appendiculata TaxID=1370023 RepID=W4VRD8_9DIPT